MSFLRNWIEANPSQTQIKVTAQSFHQKLIPSLQSEWLTEFIGKETNLDYTAAPYVGIDWTPLMDFSISINGMYIGFIK